MTTSIDDELPGVQTLEDLLGRLRAGYVLLQPILVEIDDPWGGSSSDGGTDRTLSVRVPRIVDHDLPDELAGCRFMVVGRKRAADRTMAAFTVGRARSCDVVVDNFSVSKLHATIAHDHERDLFMLTDHGSRNGTRVDGKAVDPAATAALYAGAKVSFGAASYVFLDPPTLRKLARLSS